MINGIYFLGWRKPLLVSFLIGIFVLMGTFACVTLQPNRLSPTSPIPATETEVPSTPTPTALPPLSFQNFLDFSPRHTWDTTSEIKGISLSPDAKSVALLTSHGEESSWVELRESQDGDLIWKSDLGSAATYNAICFSADGKMVATGTIDSKIRIWNVENGELIQTILHHKWPVRYVAFSPDGTMIGAGASDSTARIWRVKDGMELGVYRIKTNARDIAFSPDSKYLAVTTNYVNVYHLPSRSDEPIVHYDNAGDTRDMGEVAFSPNGAFLIGAGTWHNNQNNKWRYRILVWDFPFNKTDPIKIPIDDAIEDAVISPDGRVLVAVYKDKGKLLLIDIADREVKGSINIGPKLYMSYSPDITTFAVVSTKTTVTIWSILE
jgi:WD40 repeat protein